LKIREAEWPVDDVEKAASTISSLMVAVEQGDQSAAEPLFAALYQELHRLARNELSRQAAPVSVSATTLLHEAYLNIAGGSHAAVAFPDRARFMSYASRVMRGLIIDHARNRQARKRGGDFEITSLRTDIVDAIAGDDVTALSEIGEAVDELAAVDPALAEVVDLKFFCGFSFAEIAAMRGTSERTIQRHWEKARLYLHRTLRDHSI
jgi:RNA polymerase sigma factor (TIGR02999 family)